MAMLMLTGCKKELSLEGKLPDTERKFQLKAFYSDIPVDFDESDDDIKLETDLWAYVAEHIKDDIHYLLDQGTLQVYQNYQKMPGLNDPVLYRTYSINEESTGRFMQYLTHEYEPKRYRLYEMTDEYFIIGVKWKYGATIFSRFEKAR